MMAPRHDAKALFQAIKTQHGNKSEKQVTNLVRDFSSRTLKRDEKIETFNSKWLDTVRVVEKATT